MSPSDGRLKLFGRLASQYRLALEDTWAFVSGGEDCHQAQGNNMPLGDARNLLLVAAHLLFPMLWAKATCSGSQVSKVVDLTFEQCTPNDR